MLHKCAYVVVLVICHHMPKPELETPRMCCDKVCVPGENRTTSELKNSGIVELRFCSATGLQNNSSGGCTVNTGKYVSGQSGQSASWETRENGTLKFAFELFLCWPPVHSNMSYAFQKSEAGACVGWTQPSQLVNI